MALQNSNRVFIGSTGHELYHGNTGVPHVLLTRSRVSVKGAYAYIPTETSECARVCACVYFPHHTVFSCYGRLLVEPRLVWSVRELQCVPFFDMSVWGGAGGSVLLLPENCFIKYDSL